MGIKFLCPNGHKLNVKTFLAGKRAICPKCQARVIVPMSSAGADSEPAGGSTILTSEDMAAAGIPPVGPVTVVGACRWRLARAGRDRGGPGQRALARLRSDCRSARAPSGTCDRPAGGQFGPASGDVMRAWIQEGRVGASSLVWRAGWSDWRQAAATFPQLAALTAPSSGVAVSAVAGANGASVVPVAALVARPACQSLIGRPVREFLKLRSRWCRRFAVARRENRLQLAGQRRVDRHHFGPARRLGLGFHAQGHDGGERRRTKWRRPEMR